MIGKIPISGQDATAAGCNSIIENKLTLTVYKDVRRLSPIAIDLAIKLARKEKLDDMQNFSLSELTGDSRIQGNVPCRFLEVIGIDKDSVYNKIVKSGFQKYDDVYRGVQEDKRPPRP